MTPKHVVGLSGGKDSTCLALALREREPRDYEYICTPTGNELPELFDHLDRLEVLLDAPIKRLGIGKTLYQLIDEMQMLPNFRARWCTRILKIEPTIEYMATLPPGSRLYVGLRADEEERQGIYGDEVTSVFPFREWGWGEADVWKYLNERGVHIPTRTDCGACYHQRIGEWRNFHRDHRDLFNEAAAIETRLGHTFRSPGRDTWPVDLVGLGAAFDSGRQVRGRSKSGGETCRVCSL
jgi:3'-phosphoadenosine 5'-phosphosulfate sulfotransferase (PAPS reductase)/FAD synthetase